MAKSFSEQEKVNIRQALIKQCKASWQMFGYKRTNLDDLCVKCGISKGTFYLFYSSKERLFYEVLQEVQNTLYQMVEEILSENQNKSGVSQALKKVYAEYDKNPFLYDTTSQDFLSFLNKLSSEEKETIYYNSLTGAKQMLDKPYLTLKINENQALSVLASLLNMITNKDKLLADHFMVFDFMLDHLIDEIFE